MIEATVAWCVWFVKGVITQGKSVGFCSFLLTETFKKMLCPIYRKGQGVTGGWKCKRSGKKDDYT